jgi:hypothetical protein
MAAHLPVNIGQLAGTPIARRRVAVQKLVQEDFIVMPVRLGEAGHR